MMQVDDAISLLNESGLIPTEEVRRVIDRLSAELRLTSGEELLEHLVAAGELTAYQASVLCSGTTQGLVLGEYTLLAKIGAGGMGQVYKARHGRLKRIVAIKILPSHLVDSESAIARFAQEMETMARLDHTNIVIAHDAGVANGVHFLVMQLVDGEDLASIVARRGTLPVAEAVEYVLQAARGLAYAHGEGVIHRDLKPANLLVDKSGTLKVLDMGLARLTNTAHDAATADQLTGTGQIMGTVDYMSPEQAMNTKNADHRSDIYSLGCTLHTLLTRRPLYEGESIVEKILAHREQPIRSLASDRNDVPPQLDAIFQKMVAKQATDRYQTMSDVVDALTTLTQEVPLSREKSSHAQATIAFQSDPTQANQQDKHPPKQVQGAIVTIVEPSGATPQPTVSESSPAQQETITANRADESTNTSIRSGKGSRRRYRNPRPKPKRSKLLPVVLLLAVCGAVGYVLSQAEYRQWVIQLFRGDKNQLTDAEDSHIASWRGVDLIELIDLERDAVVGKWRREADAIISPDTTAARLQIPYLPPEQYDLTIVAEPLTFNAGLVLGLIAEGHQVSAAIGLKEDKSGLATKASFEFPDPAATNRGQVFRAGKPTTIVCRIRTRQLTIEADDRTIIDYRGDIDQLKAFDLWAVDNSRVLSLGTAISSYRITKLELVPIVGAGKALE